MAASVSTFVVSWKEAAEIQLSVDSDADVIPSRIGSDVAASASRYSITFFAFFRRSPFASRAFFFEIT